MMTAPLICAVITTLETGPTPEAWTGADLLEIRIDMIGKGWEKAAHSANMPWIATNRLKAEGGYWEGSEEARRAELLKAISMGASIVDIELASPDLEEIVPLIKKKARCMISHHDMRRTPPRAELSRLLKDELAAGADICKLVTTAGGFDDNITLLGMISEFQPADIVAFCMGELGQMSRILCPLSGGLFTYASLTTGESSAPGQLTVPRMRNIYGVLRL
jgi:3-dehydroquinate dehydratase type I